MIPDEVKQKAKKIEILKFRGGDFVNREKEIRYWHRTFFGWPFLIHFVYGPKSCGKTTLLEKVRDDILADENLKNKITFFWYDLRGEIFVNYKNVLDFLFPLYDIYEERMKEERKGVEINLKVFKITKEIKEAIEKKEITPTLIMNRAIDREVAKGKKVVIVLDELQALKDIYINEKRTILKELLNYFVRITKVEHKAVVIGMSSNAFFIEQLYNDSTLEGASEFVYLDYLNLPEIYAWLTRYGFTEDEIEYIWEKVGGYNYLISRIIQAKKEGEDWRKIIDLSIQQAKGKIIDLLGDIKDENKRQRVIQVLKEFTENGPRLKLNIERYTGEYKEIIRFLVDREIIFYDPLRAELWIQFKSHYFAMQELFRNNSEHKN